MVWLKVQYFLLVLVASCGVLQIVFTLRGIKGLLFFTRKPLSYSVGSGLILGAFVWFYLTGDRSIAPVLEGSQQTTEFLGAATGAVFLTAGITSVLTRRRLFTDCKPGVVDADHVGLGELRRCNYFQCLPQILIDVRGILARSARRAHK